MTGPRTGLKAHYSLIARLLDGEVLDRQRVAKELGVQAASADRHLRAMRDALPQLLVHRTSSRQRTVRLPASQVQREPTKTMAVAAALGAALSNLFRGSSYERNLLEALDHVLERVKTRAEFKDADRKFYFVAQGGEAALPDKEAELDEIVDAILQNAVLKFDYVHFGGKSRPRTVEPLTLAVYQHQLYLLARESGKFTVVRLSRIENANASRKRFSYPSRIEYDPRRVFRNVVGIFVKEEPHFPAVDVEFQLTADWRIYAQTHRWHESQTTTVGLDGVTVRLHVAICPELEQLILGFGENCRVIQPKELKEKIALRRTRMVKLDADELE